MNSLKLGMFLAVKTVLHASKWTTALIIMVMLITFLNLVIVSGILVGLIQGSEVAFREKYLGDVIVSPLEKKTKIERAGEIESLLAGISDVKGYTARYISGGSVEANYATRRSDDIANKKNVSIRGINPEQEDVVTKLSDNMLEGEYLTSADAGKYILIGKDVLAKYSVVADVDATALRDVEPGTKVRVSIGTTTQEYKVKGIVKIKAGDLSSGIFMVDSELRKFANKNISDVDEIAIKLNQGGNAVKVRDTLLQNGFGDYAKIQTFEEGTPAFVINMKQLFGALGTLFGSVGVVVAAITLFIVIFINALTKRRQIGILKGIGITSGTILWSYVFQSVFYAFCGSMLGLIATFGWLKPFFDKHPIDFPFSDGILVAEVSTTMIRVGTLIFVAMLAGLIPAWMVVRRNTLNAILGR
jgi:ABC-type lipoprotein release transport system permease subunit